MNEQGVVELELLVRWSKASQSTKKQKAKQSKACEVFAGDGKKGCFWNGGKAKTGPQTEQ